MLIVGGVAYTVWQNKQPVGLHGWLEIWNRWDGAHYLDIARDGYVTQGDQQNWTVFYPLYPWAVRLFTLILRDHLLSAFAVSGLASVVAGVLLRKLTDLDFGATVSRTAVWFMFIFPTSYFLHIGYTESLFLAFALGSFLAARRGKWWLAGVTGAFECLTRVNGLLLIPALGCEALCNTALKRGVLRAEWLWIAFIGVGFMLYLFLNFHVFGHPFAFVQILRDRFFKTPKWPWVGIFKVWTWKGAMRGDCIGMRRRNSFSSCSALPVRSGVGGPARIVCRVDGAKLAAVYEHLVRDQRASLHSGNVSHFHSLRTFHGGATGLVWHHYFLVANVYGALHNALRAGRVGVLILSWLATLLHYETAVE